jgi:MoxR-like ATPase
MMKVLVNYPSSTEEFVVVERALTKTQPIQAIIEPDKLIALQQRVDTVYVDPSLIEYAVRLTGATRMPAMVGLGKLGRYITFGASPRASINMLLGARALAYIRGRDYALPHDLIDLSLDILRHRLVLSYEALADEVTADVLLSEIISRMPVPEFVPQGMQVR